MLEKIKIITMWISLCVAALISIMAILFAADQQKFGAMFDIAFWVIVCYMVLSLLVWLFYGILSLRSKPKKTIIFACTAVVVIVASVLLALGDTMPQDFLLRFNTSASTAKLIAIGVYATYILVIGALVLMIYSAISKSFKK
jgi:MFS family permease